MSVKDFDKAWKEQNKEGYPFKVKGEEYELPPSVPAKAMLEALDMQEKYDADEDVPEKEAIDLAINLIGEEDVNQMLDDGITTDELTDIIEWSNEIYSIETEDGGSGKAD